MKLRTALRLGRVSNLPTIWTNVLAGVALSGGVLPARSYPLLALGMTLFYVGGIYLNDAFDREHDARVRPERPIPSGEVSARSVFVLGYGVLAANHLAVSAGACCATSRKSAPRSGEEAVDMGRVYHESRHDAGSGCAYNFQIGSATDGPGRPSA